MNIETNSVKDTELLMVWVNDSLAMRQIKRILKNKHSAHDQIKAIRKLLENSNAEVEPK